MKQKIIKTSNNDYENATIFIAKEWLKRVKAKKLIQFDYVNIATKKEAKENELLSDTKENKKYYIDISGSIFGFDDEIELVNIINELDIFMYLAGQLRYIK